MSHCRVYYAPIVNVCNHIAPFLSYVINAVSSCRDKVVVFLN